MTIDKLTGRKKSTYQIANMNSRPDTGRTGARQKPRNQSTSTGASSGQIRGGTRVPKLNDIFITGKDGAAYSLGDIFQMLEIDLIMGRKKDFHKRLLHTIRAVAKPALAASTFKGKRFEPPRALNDH